MNGSGIHNSDAVSHTGVIARNTFLLLVRMLVLTVINLYAVRVLLRALGDDDYGLYTAVAGVVSLLSCVSTVLSISTQRFYSYESGRNNDSRLNEIFCKSLNLNLALSAAVVFLLETIGLWYVCTRMDIPADRVYAVHWVYQFAIFSLVCMLLQIPFMAAVMAHEDMGIYTIITTAECLLKLLVIYLIGLGGIDRLIFYSGGLFAVFLVTFLAYAVTAGLRYGECHYHRQKDTSLYKDLLLFSGWTFYGSFAGVALIQGNVLLLNRFFRPAINAAFGVAVQIQSAFNQLCNSIVLAIRPAMIRSYAAGDFIGLNFLFSFCNKALFYIVTLIGIPLIVEMPSVMQLWLAENSTPEKILFARLMVFYVIAMTMQNPITIIMQASGNIKLYHLITDSVLLLCIPASWCMFRMGMPAFVVLVSMISVCIMAHFIRLWCLKKNYEQFSIRNYLLGFALPYVLLAGLTFWGALSVHRVAGSPVFRFLLVVAASVILLTLLVFLFGLTAQEKVYVRSFISKTLKGKK